MRAAAHPGMQSEAVRFGAQACGGFVVPAGHGAQTQHLPSDTRPQRNAVGAGGRLQGRERVIGIEVGDVAHALVFQAPSSTRQCRRMFKLAVEPNLWMSVTAAVSAVARLRPSCLSAAPN